MVSFIRLQALFALFVVPIVFLSCASSQSTADLDLNNFNISVEEPGAENENYILQLNGFSGSDSEEYTVAMSRLNNHEWDDILSIEEIENQQERTILVEIKNNPQSYNRVLWALGSEHFQNHATDYDFPSATGTDRDKMPELKGGIEAVMSEVTYPDALNGIEGRVMVELIVTRFGEVSEPAVVQSLHYAADREAIRAVNRMKFSPGVLDGLPIKVKYTLPVFFREP
ncbi:energy transducer TonB [Rhodohalobacter sp.]|uniref:energy transducer TonB n=1 Tax=Rhodohalobacter sp. TaxID=1974210 RepID=UPI003561B525